MHVYGCILCVATVLQVEATVFELFQLPQNSHPHPQVILYPVTMDNTISGQPQPLCNDGSQAGYYHDTDYSKLAKIHVQLQVITGTGPVFTVQNRFL